MNTGGQQGNNDRMSWWRKARFGMFIHWGLYAVPAGVWQGRHIEGIGEWIMNWARIPVAEYERFARQFNPVQYNAAEWVQLAKDAGMKYLVITAKHHDGFAMFNSPSSDYDITDATPYGRDPMVDLVAECRKAGIVPCFYYSQTLDWHDPDGAGNTWDYPDEDAKDFEAYLERKVIPQLTELLTQYGPIGLIWFDCPGKISREQSQRLRDLVISLQPDCLVSGRIGNDIGDYGSLRDNEHPEGPIQGFWETPCTLNDTWGYKTYDENWKSEDDLINLLVNCASKGVNYLLNVGPTAEGVIPEPSIERLRKVGTWLQHNGEAIYGSEASPYPFDFEWGKMTQRENVLYLHVTKRQCVSVRLTGLRNQVRSARILGPGQTPVECTERHDAESDRHCIELTLPAEASDRYVTVVALELDGHPDVSPSA
ncbi:MAG: alpha-L-fucosidase [Candidatus Pacebacteria bacterium]|nr:alpha-L-fucosidase [Candidatus Paceibacterota bacterium]